jgi:hypothetical protein
MPSGSGWLVKFQALGDHKEVCAIEAFYAQLAQACAWDMPDAQVFDWSAQDAALGIERFDLAQGQRVPIHSLAGFLQADFRIPSAVDYTTFLRATRMITRDEREVEKAFERAVFNVLFHNRDDHAKKFRTPHGRTTALETRALFGPDLQPGPRWKASDGRLRRRFEHPPQPYAAAGSTGRSE